MTPTAEFVTATDTTLIHIHVPAGTAANVVGVASPFMVTIRVAPLLTQIARDGVVRVMSVVAGIGSAWTIDPGPMGADTFVTRAIRITLDL